MEGRIKFELDVGNSTDVDKVYDVLNHKDEELGKVYFNSDWNKWVFAPIYDSYFDAECLSRIVQRLLELKSKLKMKG